MTEVRSVTLAIGAGDEDVPPGADVVVAVTLALTLRDADGILHERSVVLTPTESTSIDDLMAVLPELIASVRHESLAPAMPPPEADVDGVIVLDSFDFDALSFGRDD